jgi:4-hydroxythreonine-4-phosphate dehydrogenase
MTEFIFMLTRSDVTVADAMEQYRAVRDTALRWVGFKDVGLPFGELRSLARAAHDDGRQVALEVVSLDEASERRSIEAGREIGVDLLMGGVRPDVALPMLDGTGIRYFPFPGEVVGHPSVLRGTVDEIAASAGAMAHTPGVDGLDLLAYRFAGDVPDLIRRVVDAAGCPVVVAGSVDAVTRIEAVRAAGAWAFTVGSAVFDFAFPAGATTREQVAFILDAVHQIDDAATGRADGATSWAADGATT